MPFPTYSVGNMDLAGFFFHLQTHGFEIMNQGEGLIFHHPLFNRNRRDLAASIHEMTNFTPSGGLFSQPQVNTALSTNNLMGATANLANNSLGGNFSNASRGKSLCLFLDQMHEITWSPYKDLAPIIQIQQTLSQCLVCKCLVIT